MKNAKRQKRTITTVQLFILLTIMLTLPLLLACSSGLNGTYVSVENPLFAALEGIWDDTPYDDAFYAEMTEMWKALNDEEGYVDDYVEEKDAFGNGRQGRYKVTFNKNGTCTWYQDGLSFLGTYEKKDGAYEILIIGEGEFLDAIFTATPNADGIVIDGGMIDEWQFIKESEAE